MERPVTVWENRIVGYGYERVDELLANPRNYRIHSMAQQEALLGVLREIGIVQTIIVNRLTGFVVDGHARVVLAMREGIEVLPTSYVELTEPDEAEMMLTFDRIGAMAGIDKDKLAELAAIAKPMSDLTSDFIDSLVPAKAEPREHKISPELLERQDYLVFIFDNQIDWQNVCEQFGIGTAYQQDPDTAPAGKQFSIFGTGRVLMGRDLLRKLGRTGESDDNRD